MKNYFFKLIRFKSIAEMYWEPHQTSKIGLLGEMINSFETFTFFARNNHLRCCPINFWATWPTRSYLWEKQTDFSENFSKKYMGTTFPGEYHFFKFISCLANTDFFSHLTISAINDLRKYKPRFFLIPFYCVIPDAFLDFILFILLSIILSIQ